VGQTRIAKLFKNGASQAVRLPAEFCFDGDEVYATRDDRTGDVMLSSRRGVAIWAEFFELMETIAVPDDFMAERPMNQLPQERVGTETDDWIACARRFARPLIKAEGLDDDAIDRLIKAAQHEAEPQRG
jgi:antitoxin VapB